MTLEELEAKVRDWDLGSGGPIADAKYTYILSRLYHHARKDWKVYLPAEYSDFNPDYMERLSTWLDNVTTDEDQKLLLEYALFISFFSHDDFVALYTTAMRREVYRWVTSQVSANLLAGSQGFSDLLTQEIQETTWFCPVTDSMDINEFYKVNHLKGIAHRPGFSTLQMLAEMPGSPNPTLAASVASYMANPSPDPGYRMRALERIVLLEDIVGSGTQCIRALRWAIDNLQKPILFIPLILCPNGVDALRAEETRSGGLLTVCPIVQLSRSDILGPERRGVAAWPISELLEDLANRFQGRFAPLGRFGYRDTGCSIVTFANTPDNSLPMIHHKTNNGTWFPLFPRVYRGD